MGLRKDPVGRGKQDLEQPKFPVAQFARFGADGQRGGQRVESQAREGPHGLQRAAAPAKHRPATRLKLGEIERFGDIIVRPKVKNIDPVRHRGARSHHDDRGVAARPPFRFQEVAAISVRQGNIKQDQVVTRRRKAIPRLGQGGGRVDGVAIKAQPVRDRTGKLWIVLDQQEAHLTHG